MSNKQQQKQNNFLQFNTEPNLIELFLSKKNQINKITNSRTEDSFLSQMSKQPSSNTSSDNEKKSVDITNYEHKMQNKIKNEINQIQNQLSIISNQSASSKHLNILAKDFETCRYSQNKSQVFDEVDIGKKMLEQIPKTPKTHYQHSQLFYQPANKNINLCKISDNNSDDENMDSLNDLLEASNYEQDLNNLSTRITNSNSGGTIKNSSTLFTPVSSNKNLREKFDDSFQYKSQMQSIQKQNKLFYQQNNNQLKFFNTQNKQQQNYYNNNTNNNNNYQQNNQFNQIANQNQFFQQNNQQQYFSNNQNQFFNQNNLYNQFNASKQIGHSDTINQQQYKISQNNYKNQLYRKKQLQQNLSFSGDYQYLINNNLNNNKSRKQFKIEDNDEKYILVPENIDQDNRTTLMIKNIPNKYNKELLLQTINQNYEGKYNFFYLPIDYQKKCNVGYAFINFKQKDSIKQFYQEFNNKSWSNFKSDKICYIRYAHLQGMDEIKLHFDKSSVMNQQNQHLRPLMLTEDNQQKFLQVVETQKKSIQSQSLKNLQKSQNYDV